MRIINAKDSVSAFTEINRYMIVENEGITNNGFISKSQNIMYNTMVNIHKSYIPETYDFTRTVNYRPAKWSSLVRNYVDMGHLQEICAVVQSRELKKAAAYTISFHFSNQHGGGKGCLLTCTFTRRPGNESPILVVSVRASEVYKRLMVDLVLLHRIGEYAYGEGADFSIELWLPHAWQGVSWAAMFLGTCTLKKLKEIEQQVKEHPTVFSKAVFEKLEYFKSVDWSKFSYNADKRAAKVIQRDVASPPLLASHCNL
jgi:hypothetical protein